MLYQLQISNQNIFLSSENYKSPTQKTKMDKNQTIGIVLISVMLLIYLALFNEPQQPNQKKPTETKQVDNQPTKPAIIETVKNNIDSNNVFAGTQKGTAEDIILENSKVKLVFSTLGGKIKSAELKDYVTHNDYITKNKKKLILFDEKSSAMALSLPLNSGNIDLYQVYFSPEKTANTLTFRANLGANKAFTQTYTLNDNYEISYSISSKGLEKDLKTTPTQFTWKASLQKTEYYLVQERNKSTINFHSEADGYDFLTEASPDPQTMTAESPVRWVSFQQQFFLASLIAKKETTLGMPIMKTSVPTDSVTVKNYELIAPLSTADVQAGKANYIFYLGPNKYDIIKKIDSEGFDRNVGLGWGIFSWVNKFLIIPIFSFLGGFISNFGILIFLLVLVVKTILLPLTYKSYVGMAKTRIMKPQADAIKAKYPDDTQKSQVETMALYKEVGVNPIGGCLPMFLQLPITFAMFTFFPNSIELRQQTFLWANDLSTFDSVLSIPNIPFYGDHVSLFTILMTISTIVYTWYNNQNMTTVEGPQKIVGYLMPVIFMFVLNSFAAGLTYYYLCTNIVSIGQQILIKYFVDEDKLKLSLDNYREKNKGKEKKPSMFQERLEKAMKAQAEKKAKKS